MSRERTKHKNSQVVQDLMTSKEKGQQAALPPDCHSCELPLDSLVETIQQTHRHIFKRGKFQLHEVETDDRSWRCGRCGENLSAEAWKTVSGMMTVGKWASRLAALEAGRGRKA
jgi:hypothetical protein